MMNKRGYLTRDYLIAIILGMGIISLMVLMIHGVSNNYPNSDIEDQNFAGTYDKIDNVTEGVKVILNTTRSGEGLSFRGAFDVTFGAAFTAIQLVYSSLGLLQDIFSNFAVDFGIPIQIANVLFIIAFTAITVTLVYVWLSSISRGRI